MLKNYYFEASRLIEKRPIRFFVVENGRYVTEHTARYSFSQVSQNIGLRKAALYFKHGRGPRIHDLRHTFAVNVLLEATRAGRDIDEAIFRLCTILGHKNLDSTYYYLQSVPELMKLISNQNRKFGASRMRYGHNIAPYIQDYFKISLMLERNVSQNTIDTYKYVFQIFLDYCQELLRIRKDLLSLEDVNSELVGQFLTHLERKRNNSISTRNARLAAIQSFFTYVLGKEPDLMNHCHKILSIPYKTADSQPMCFLSNNECEAILNLNQGTTWYEKRDKLILRLMIETGLRVSELTKITVADLNGPSITIFGKGKKYRSASLYDQTTDKVIDWIRYNRLEYADPIFGSRKKQELNRDSISRIVRKYVERSQSRCKTLTRKNITPHSLRHTFAMRNLEAGVKLPNLSLLMGHADTKSTLPYLHASNAIKKEALEMLDRLEDLGPEKIESNEDKLTDFLKGL